MFETFWNHHRENSGRRMPFGDTHRTRYPWTDSKEHPSLRHPTPTLVEKPRKDQEKNVGENGPSVVKTAKKIQETKPG